MSRAFGIPCTIVLGQHDYATPAPTAATLHRAWPDSRLQLIDDAGLDTGDAGMLDGFMEAIHRHARQH